MPAKQIDGTHIDAPQLVTSLAFETVKAYDDYTARLKQMPRAFREVTIQMRKGMAERLMPPKILLEQASKQANDLAIKDKALYKELKQKAIDCGLIQGPPKTEREADTSGYRKREQAQIDAVNAQFGRPKA